MNRIEPLFTAKKLNIVSCLWPHRLVWSRTPDFHSDNRGSNPLGVSTSHCYNGKANVAVQFFCSFESLAQRLEHLTFNEGVDGSNPSRLTLYFVYPIFDIPFEFQKVYAFFDTSKNENY
jgi:hypothetical protein